MQSEFEASRTTEASSRRTEAAEEEEEQSDFLNFSGIPEWVRPDSAVALAESKAADGQPVPLGMLAGAALPSAFLVTLLLWGSMLSYVFITTQVAKCDENGFSTVSKWSTLSFAPVWAVAIFSDFLCFRQVAIPKYQILKRFQFLGVSLSFYPWLAVTSMRSALRFYQFYSVGTFFGLVFKAEHCKAGEKLAHAWEQTMHQSFFGMLPYSEHLLPSLRTMLCLGLALVFVQLIFALLHSVPTDPCKVNYEMCLIKGRKYATQYSLLTGDEQNHGAALMTLAEANGMYLVAWEDLAYALKKADNMFRAMENTEEKDREKGILKKITAHPMSQVKTGFQKLFLAGALWNGLLLNVQVTVFAFRHHEDKNGNGQTLLALVVTLFTLLPIIFDGIRATWNTLKWYRKLSGALASMRADEVEDEQQDLNYYRGWWLALLLALMVTSAQWMYAAVKLVMIFHCQDSMWNITGCVHLG